VALIVWLYYVYNIVSRFFVFVLFMFNFIVNFVSVRFHNYFSIHFYILLNNTLEYVFLHTLNLDRNSLTNNVNTSTAFVFVFLQMLVSQSNFKGD
jgi:hypothetical protein